MRAYTIRQRSGFTTAELITVILIIGIGAAVTLPRMAGTVAQTQAESIALQIQADLELARRTAMNRGRVITVQFDWDQATYQCADVAAGGAGSGTLSVDLKQQYDASTVLTADFFESPGIQFAPSGQPTMTTDSGRVHRGDIYVHMGGHTITLHIHPRLSLVTVAGGR